MTDNVPTKKTIRKKASKKADKPVGSAGILESIKAELEQEYTTKIDILLKEHNTLVNSLQDECKGLNVQLDALRAERHKYSDIDSKIRDLTEKEQSIKSALIKMQEEREQNINDVINTRTERMRTKMEEQFKERAAKLQNELTIGLDIQIQHLYNQLGTILKQSKVNPAVMYQTLGLLQQTVLLEQRRRLGVDADPNKPDPAESPDKD